MEEVVLPPANQQVKRIKMYGTKDSVYHTPGEVTMVDPVNVEYFKSKGLSLTKPSDVQEDEEDDAPPPATKGKTMLTVDPVIASALAKK